ncbi:MAG: hypothetical protein Q4C91_06250 [Eubacteriales bacterium]|nr:hypothetical protein [Eubacteriales bacterium]
MDRKKTILWLILDILLVILVAFEICVLAGGKEGIFGKSDNPGEGAVKVETEKAESVPSVTPVQELSPTPVPDQETEAVMTRSDFIQETDRTLADAEGVWEIYISDLSGNVSYQKNSGQNMHAGDILYFFMLDQVYSDIDSGMDRSYAQAAEELMNNRSSDPYWDMIDVLFDTSLERDDMERFVLEQYPFTIWETENEAGYTSAGDGAELIKTIVHAAKDGSSYAQKELDYLRAGWNQGIISDTTGQGTVVELYAKQEERIEDFAMVTLEDGAGYLIGIMAEELPDPELADGIVRRIAELAQEYYTGAV